MPQREARILSAAVDDLRLERLEGREALGQPYEYQLLVDAPDPHLPLEGLLGTKLAVGIDLYDGTVRPIHGYVAAAAAIGNSGTRGRYALTLVPWLWFLSRRQDCRIFQQMTAVEVVRAVFDGWEGADFTERLVESYPTRDYCVQYRESDLAFVSRLLEDEGISFFFTHTERAHRLVLADHPDAHEARPGYDEVPYSPPLATRHRERDGLDTWRSLAGVRAGKATLRSFDFERPRADLTVADENPRRHPLAAAEVYDYPGPYVRLEHGDRLARLRLEELQADHARFEGGGDACGLDCGGRFTLVDAPREEQATEYLVLAVEHRVVLPHHRSGPEDLSAPYRCRVEAQDMRVPYRPPRATPRPVVQGPQTAIVTGPAGEEIHTDRYGRVKVRFHWDRSGRNDGTSSCWVRVSQAWAGASWGSIHVPRIGQEVVVDFLEGDPDQPIVTGRVYNAACMPPYGLPGNATQSGIKSNSSKGGGGSNELRFEDRKGAEEVYLHAQKDEVIVVENDKTETVHHDEAIRIDNDRTESVGHDETLAVGNDRTRTVGANEAVTVAIDQAITVGANRTLTVGANQTVTIAANHTETVAGARVDTVLLTEANTVGLAQQTAVGASRTVQVGGPQDHTVGASDSWRVGSDRSADIGGSDSLNVGKDRSATVGANDSLSVTGAQSVSVGKTISITAADSVTITTGSASITMKKNGDITIKGKDITIDGSGKITVKAGGDIVMKGQKILQN